MEFLNNVHRINGQPIIETERNHYDVRKGYGIKRYRPRFNLRL
jgi:hypothetical protein